MLLRRTQSRTRLAETSVWADKEADYVNPAFSGEMPVPETARKLATFMNDALAKEKG